MRGTLRPRMTSPGSTIVSITPDDSSCARCPRLGSSRISMGPPVGNANGRGTGCAASAACTSSLSQPTPHKRARREPTRGTA
jgi:hydroxymethylpyrimidine/phosphomethylpyrimidine kinase